MGKRLYTVTIERQITFLHTVRVMAADEDDAKARACAKMREGDWFGGEVVADDDAWVTVTPSQAAMVAEAAASPAGQQGGYRD